MSSNANPECGSPAHDVASNTPSPRFHSARMRRSQRSPHSLSGRTCGFARLAGTAPTRGTGGGLKYRSHCPATGWFCGLACVPRLSTSSLNTDRESAGKGNGLGPEDRWPCQWGPPWARRRLRDALWSAVSTPASRPGEGRGAGADARRVGSSRSASVNSD